MNTIRISSLLSFVVISTMLTGCGGSLSTTGTMSLSVADTPVDSATSVVVTFTGVQMQGATGSPTTFTFSSPKQIDLLTTQNGKSALLLDRATVPAGIYQWIRLMIDDSQSTITLNDGTVHPLTMPSVAQTGLKLMSSFSVAAGSQTNFTIDFNLRKSIALANGSYILTPALRLINNQQIRTITGSASNTFTIGGTSVTSTTCGPAVYVYSGANKTPVDINTTSIVQPIETATLSLNNAKGSYDYKVAFLVPGDYTLVVTCAADDDPSTSDALTYSAAKNAIVTDNSMATVDFP